MDIKFTREKAERIQPPMLGVRRIGAKMAAGALSKAIANPRAVELARHASALKNVASKRASTIGKTATRAMGRAADAALQLKQKFK